MSLIQATLEIPLLYFQCTGTLYTSDESRGGTRGGALGTPLFLDQTEAQRAEKKFFLRQPQPPLSGYLQGTSKWPLN